LHNPWLTYGIGIHRLREACLGTDLMDDLDETSLSLDEVYDFCHEFFIGKYNDLPLSNPSRDFDGFLSDLRNILSRQKLVWNPVKNKLSSWIDVDKLDSLFREKASSGRTGKRESYCRVPPSLAAKKNGRSMNSIYHSPPQAPIRRAASENPNSKDIDAAIKRWSMSKNGTDSMKLEKLLVDIPTLFPRSNNAVEDHEYFDKWNDFPEDAFKEEDEKTKRELLKRAARKAQRFFKGDQVPKDLTENQKTMFKSISSVLSKSMYREEKSIDLDNFSKTNF
jgi:hypothetical protein